LDPGDNWLTIEGGGADGPRLHLAGDIFMSGRILLGSMAAALVGIGGCGAPEVILPPGPDMLAFNFNFANGDEGWEAGFADLPPGAEDQFMLSAMIAPLPAEVSTSTGFEIVGFNQSDDLFMFLKRRLGPADGVEPGAEYQARFRVIFASNAPTGCVGIGGAPGESVTLKAGATDTEPRVVQEVGVLRLNVDKGDQAEGGPDASVAGDIANGVDCADVEDLDSSGFVTIQRVHVHNELVTPNASGEIWLLVGTDSGFEGLTRLFYRRIDVELVPTSVTD
jgi:hypothetical protein